MASRYTTFARIPAAALLVLALLLALPHFAPAAEADNEYVLGTQLVLTSPAQLSYPPTSYWGELTPIEYRFGLCYIVDAINAARLKRGEAAMVDVTKYPINIGGESNPGDYWEYTIDFTQMSPADVDAALTAFPLSGALAELPRSYRGVTSASYYASSESGQLALDVQGERIEIDLSQSMPAIRETVSAELMRIFGEGYEYDFSFSYYLSLYYPEPSASLSVSVYKSGAEFQPYMDEHGE